MKNIEQFFEQSKEVVGAFDEFVLSNNLKENIVADHICFKCESGESYEEWRRVFERNSKNIYQAIISKRRIAIVTLSEPIRTIAGEIKYLELSDQKPDLSQTEGFDHVEFFPREGDIDELLKILNEKNIVYEKDEKPHILQYIINLEKYNLRLAKERVVDKIKREEFV